MNSMKPMFFLFFALAVLVPQTGQAESLDFPNSEYENENDEGRSGDFDLEEDSETRVKNPAEIVTRLEDIEGRCRAVGGYTTDCLAERLEVLEKEMSGLAGYADARNIIRDTAAQLRQITQDNLDLDRPKARIESRDGSFRSSRPLSAVSPAQKQQVIAQTLAVLNEAETRLLRSAAASTGRAVQYQQIAAALGSNKVLLRSS